MLAGLGAIAVINAGNEGGLLLTDAPWRLTVTPGAGAQTSATYSLMDAFANSDLVNGEVTLTQSGNNLVFEGKVSNGRGGRTATAYRNELLTMVGTFLPVQSYEFQAEATPVVNSNGTGSGSTTGTGGTSGSGSTSTGTGGGTSSGLPSKIFGIDTKFLVIAGIGLLIFMGSKEGK